MHVDLLMDTLVVISVDIQTSRYSRRYTRRYVSAPGAGVGPPAVAAGEEGEEGGQH